MSQRSCSVDDCSSPVRARGWCHKHYQRWQYSGSVDRATDHLPRADSCAVTGCDTAVRTRGWCVMHYNRWYRYGDPSISKRPQGKRSLSLEQRLWAKVDKGGPPPDHAPHLGGCWLWNGNRSKEGYGRLGIGGRGGRGVFVHRLAYELLVGPIPEGLQIDHLCRVPPCLRPDHLEPVTAAVNHQRRAPFGRSRAVPFPDACPEGHDLADVVLKVTLTWECPCGQSHATQRIARPRRRKPGTASLTPLTISGTLVPTSSSPQQGDLR